jgi:hypothetical protein
MKSQVLLLVAAAAVLAGAASAFAPAITGINLARQQSRCRAQRDREIGREGEGIDATLAQLRTSHGDIVQISTVGMDANLKQMRALHGEIAKQNNKLDLQNNKLDLQTKMQSLAFAIENADRNSFKFYSSSGEELDSSELVVELLLCFRGGWCFSIQGDYGTMSTFFYNYINESDRAESQQEFRDRLSDQIQELTGVEPRFEYEEEEEQYNIYYS